MDIGILIVSVCGMLTGAGVIMMIIYSHSREKIKYMINSALAKSLGQNSEEKLFKCTHYDISVCRYNNIRLAASGVIVLIGIATVNKVMVIGAIALYITFYPKKEIRGLRLPFGWIYTFYRKKDKDLKDEELLEALSLLKNMMVQLRHNPKGADYIVDYLSGTAELTKSAFFKFLNLIRLGKPEVAEKIFIEEIGTTLAADTARILVQLDNVDPITLEQNLISIQNEIRQIGNTHKQTKNELYSDLILVPIVTTMMFVFLNFLLVVYIGELSTLSYFFKM